MSRLTITPLSPALGAEVSGIALNEPIDGETLAEFKAAWAKHLVLRVRGQRMSDPQLLAFTRQLGPLDPPGPNPYGKPFLEDFPEINVISNVKVGGEPIGNLGDGEATWHCDMTYVDTPPRAAMLHALEVPPSGGDTFWANMYLAYERLPEPTRQRIATLRAVHDSTYNSAGVMRKGMEEVTDPREAPGARHPLVILHPDTGRPALFLGRRRNAYVVGLSLEESDALLDELWAHATRGGVHLQAGLAAGRPCPVGQPLHAASARLVRPGYSTSDASDADQGAGDHRRRRSVGASGRCAHRGLKRWPPFPAAR